MVKKIGLFHSDTESEEEESKNGDSNTFKFENGKLKGLDHDAENSPK